MTLKGRGMADVLAVDVETGVRFTVRELGEVVALLASRLEPTVPIFYSDAEFRAAELCCVGGKVLIDEAFEGAKPSPRPLSSRHHHSPLDQHTEV